MDDTRGSRLTQQVMALAVDQSKPLNKGGGQNYIEKYTYMRWPGDSKRARFESHCCPQVLFRKRRFYSKRLLLGAFVSEATRQLANW